MASQTLFVRFCITVTIVVITVLANETPQNTGTADIETNEASRPGTNETGSVNRTILDTLEEKAAIALDKIGDEAVEAVKAVQMKAVQLGENVLEIDANLHNETDEVDRVKAEMNKTAEQIDEQKDEVVYLEEEHEASVQSLRNKTNALSKAQEKLTKLIEEIQKIKDDCSSICKRSADDKHLSRVKLDKAESNSFLRSSRSRILHSILDKGLIYNSRQKRGRILEWLENRREEVKEKIEEGREWVRERAREGVERVRERIRRGKRNAKTVALCKNDNEARQQCTALLNDATAEMKALEAQITALQSAVDIAVKVTQDNKILLDAAIQALTDLDESAKLLAKALEDAQKTVDATSDKLEEAREAFDEAERVVQETKGKEKIGLLIESKMAKVGSYRVVHIKSIRYNNTEQGKANSAVEGTMVASFFDGPEQSFSLNVRAAFIDKMVDELVKIVKEDIVI